ncbi:MAG: class I SAM-dependent methyltransferase [Roseococcus sp.]
MTAATIIGLYERHARAFDAQRGRDLFERTWLDRFTALIPPGGALLDLGCGMGEPIAAHLIRAGFAVTGADSSPSLLGLCRARFPDHTWHQADMRGLDLGRSFAGILAWNSFFHLDHADQRGMFAVFERHALPGAALIFTSGPSEGVAIGEFEGEALYHASLAPEEYKSLLARHGFEVVHHLEEDPACGGHTVWLARRVSPQAVRAG